MSRRVLKISLLLLAVLFVLPGLKAQNYALKMNSATQHVLFENVPVDVGSQWTAEMWVRRDAQSNFSTLIDGHTSKFTLETWQAGNNWQYKVGYSRKGSGDQQFNYIAPIGKWVHLAYTCNGSSVTLYVNGDRIGSINQAIELPLKGFGLKGDPNESPRATIDEVRYWKRVLTQAEIKANMNQSVDISARDLVAYWYFDDRQPQVTDLSNSGLQGTIYGAGYVLANNDNFTPTHAEMEFVDIEVFNKNEYLLKAGAQNEEVLCIQVNTTGVSNPLALSAITITMEGTTSLEDVEKIALSHTGKSKNFAATKLLGEKVAPKQGEISFEGEVLLQPGANYFWVVYDLKADAAKGQAFDATFVSAVIGDEIQTAADGNPDGQRFIDDEVKVFSENLSIIPKPTSMTVSEGHFGLNTATVIRYEGEGVVAEAEFLKAYLSGSTGFDLPINAGEAVANSLSLKLVENSALGEEGYKLKVENDRLLVEANSRQALFWAIQTVRQLLPTAIESAVPVSGVAWNIPLVEIEDMPRFGFRTMHLDVGRHFFPAEFIKKYIDMLVAYKINNFHWHLTEDQGWRIEIKKYPKLASVAAWRNCDGQRYGGYYTQEEVKEIVAYATERHINIIPEIELPGHSVAVLAAYPNLGCTSGPGTYSVRCAWGISEDIICGGKEETYTFLKDVLTEVAELFPSRYIHIGGDEAPKQRWNACTDCQAKINALGITGSSQTDKSNKLQKYMVEELAQFMSEKDRNLIGWDEITHGGVPTGATIQAWNVGLDIAAWLRAGHEVYRSPYNFLYFDSPQSREPGEPGSAWMGYNTLDRVYSFEPMPGGLNATQEKRMIGIEACLWTETITTTETVEYMLNPRLAAMAERAWSTKETTDFADFSERLFDHYDRYNYLGYNARKNKAPASEERSVEICEPIELTAQAAGTSYYWNDENRSTTQSITVDKGGVYKCYVNHLGTIVENTFYVTYLEDSEDISVRSRPVEEAMELNVTGGFDTYNWYRKDSPEYPIQSGKQLVLPENEDLTDYEISGLHFISNLGSLQLDGVDDLVEFSQSTFLDNTKSYTFESWIKVNNWKNTWDVVMNKRTSNENRVGMELGNESGTIFCHVSKGSNTYGSVGGIPSGEWIHVAVVYDGSKTGNANRLKFYLNGEQKTLSYTGTIPASTPTVNSKLTLGHSDQNPAINYADIRFWNSARTADEIRDNMHSLNSYGSDLELYYPMNNLVDTKLYDTTKGVLAELKNSTGGFVSSESAPGLKVAGCESPRLTLSEITGLEGIRINELNLSVSPNPSQGKMVVSGELPAGDSVKLQVYNIHGQLVYSENFKAAGKLSHTLHLESENKGVYFVSVTAGGKKSVLKVMLK